MCWPDREPLQNTTTGAEIFEESLITIESGGTEEDVAGDGGVFDGGFEEGAMKFTL